MAREALVKLDTFMSTGLGRKRRLIKEGTPIVTFAKEAEAYKAVTEKEQNPKDVREIRSDIIQRDFAILQKLDDECDKDEVRFAEVLKGKTVCLSCGYDGDDIQGEYPNLYEGYGCPRCHSPLVTRKAEP